MTVTLSSVRKAILPQHRETYLHRQCVFDASSLKLRNLTSRETCILLAIFFVRISLSQFPSVENESSRPPTSRRLQSRF